MSARYYTHFVMTSQPQTASEFTGVVELSCTPRRTHNLREVTAILARSLDVGSRDIRILHWSRLH
jgi:hypothetical protein